MLRGRHLRTATVALIVMLLTGMTVGLASASAYTLNVQAITDDLAGFDLCKTTLGLTWYNPSYLTINAWAANPSTLGTHWYVNSYSKSGPYYVFNIPYNQWVTTGSGYASYYNYDFADDSLRTDVSHSIWIDGFNNGTTNWNVSWTRSGEYWWLLDLDVVLF